MHYPYLIALALIFIFSFALGIFTILRNPKSRVHQLWFLAQIGVSLWSGGVFAIVWFTPGINLGSLFNKLLHLGSTMIILFFFHFVLCFLMKEKEQKFKLILNYLIGLFFIILIFATTWVIKGVAPKSVFAVWVDNGILYPVYAIYYFIAVLFSIIFLLIGYKQNQGLKKKQILIILWAAVIGFGGGMTNFLPHLFNIYPFGTFVVFIYPILITYGIFYDKG